MLNGNGSVEKQIAHRARIFRVVASGPSPSNCVPTAPDQLRVADLSAPRQQRRVNDLRVIAFFCLLAFGRGCDAPRSRDGIGTEGDHPGALGSAVVRDTDGLNRTPHRHHRWAKLPHVYCKITKGATERFCIDSQRRSREAGWDWSTCDESVSLKVAARLGSFTESDGSLLLISRPVSSGPRPFTLPC